MSFRISRALATALCATLMLPAASQAAVFTVGPGGTHATIQSAIDTAANTSGDDEVRVGIGTYAEAVTIVQAVDEHLLLEGGWNATFDARTDDPSLTVIDGEDSHRPLHVEPYDGSVTVRNFTFARGASTSSAGAWVAGRNVGRATLEDCVVRDSAARSNGGGISGGGIGIGAYADAQVTARRCVIRNNSVTSFDSQASGGGIDVFSVGNGRVRLEDMDVLDNLVTGVTHAFAGGISVAALGAGHIGIDGMRIEGNSIVSQGASSGAALYMDHDPAFAGEGVTVGLRRVSAVGNSAQGDFLGGQVVLQVNGSGGVLVGDSLIADALGSRGLDAYVRTGALLQLVNVTAAGNADTDLQVQGAARIANSLADSTNFYGDPVQLQNNLFDVDPGYVDRDAGNYRLVLASPAVGGGTATPDGGLGALDLDGNARIIGPRVDMGAYEADDPTLFVDGFED